MSDQGKLIVPMPGKGDTAITWVKALLGLVPGGGSAAELLFGFLEAPIERRRNELLQAIVDKLQRLAAENRIDPEALARNERFIDVVLQVQRLAAQTSDTERREYLRNAAVNSAVDETLNDFEAAFFLDLLGRYTAFHVKCLQAITDEIRWIPSDPSDPTKSFYRGLDPEDVLGERVPALGENREFARLILERLLADGLLKKSSGRIYHGNGKLRINNNPDTTTMHITDLGKRFLTFIESPDADENTA